jgi:uncharacterized Zn-finger protein
MKQDRFIGRLTVGCSIRIPSAIAAAGRHDMTDTPSHDAPEIIIVESRKVSCDGGGGALGHPVVWYEMGDEDMVECKYCDRRFILKGSDLDPGH